MLQIKSHLSVLCLSILAMLFASGAMAQGGKVVTMTMTGGSNTYPFANASQIHQIGTSVANMQFTKGKITELGFLWSNVVNLTWSNIEIAMGEANTTANAMSTTFASNFGAKARQVVHNTPMTQNCPVIGQFVRFPLDFPYDYTGQNTLVIEIRVNALPTGTGNGYLNATSNPPGGDGCRMYFNGNTTSPTGTIGTNWGTAVQFLIVQNSTWTGANSGDWNDVGNWDGEVPSNSFGAEIPDAASTPNDPILPAQSLVKEILLKSGAIVFGGSGMVDVTENFHNEGGNFVPQNSTINLIGTSKQEVRTSGGTVGNLHIKNTSGQVRVIDQFTAANAGTITIDSGAHLYFDHDSIALSSVNFNNQGLIHFGLSGGGTVATKQSITTAAGKNLGNVDIKVLDAMDSVEFLAPAAFNSLTLSGAGNVTFFGAIDVATTFTTTMTGALSATNIAGSADLNFSMGADLIMTGTLAGRNLTHSGTGNLTINGATTLTGNATFVSVGPLAVATLNAAITADGGLIVNPAFAGAGDAVTIAGNATFNGDSNFISSNARVTGGLTAGNVNVTTNGTVAFGGGFGTSTINTLSLNGIGTLSVAGNVAINDSLTTAGSGDLSGTGNLILSGALNHTSVGNFEITGNITMAGANPYTVRAGSNGIICSRLIVSNSSGVTLEGRIHATSNGGTQIAATVAATSGLTMNDGSRIRVGSPGGVGLFQVDGAFITASGTSSLAPRIIGGLVAGDYGRVRFRSGARVNIDGLFFEAIGATSQAFAVRLENNCDVLAFNTVTILDSRATTAAVEMSTNLMPTVIRAFSVAGTSPINIDATNVSGKRIEVKEAKPFSGNLYGAGREIDPNGVLYWENPPVVDITSTGQLPNALAENQFRYMLTAVGGNQPLNWSIANHPSFLSINAITGELIGTPLRSHIGTHVFVVIASDGSNPSLSASKVLTLVVDSLTSVGITIVTPPELITGKVGENYRYALAAAGGSSVGYKWYLVNPNGLPAGLFLDSNTGEIYGMPSASAAGVYNVPIRVEDPLGNSSIKSFAMTVHSEFSDPALISGALSDGPRGGGCAMAWGQDFFMFLGFVMLLGLVAIRRRMAA